VTGNPPPKATALRIRCECGGELGVLTLPDEETACLAVYPGRGTHYRRQMSDLMRRAVPGDVATVVLPRSRPRGSGSHTGTAVSASVHVRCDSCVSERSLNSTRTVTVRVVLVTPSGARLSVEAGESVGL
jgi:hypothetical protein